jgi:FixJ family two-component response regulator
VDDDPAVRDSFRIMLESYGMEVREYSSAKDFLADPDRRSHGCLVLDMHMPEMSGLELLEILRGQGSSLPVIVLTGRGDVSLQEHVERSGAVTLLAKPVDADLLLRTIQRVAWTV